MAFQLAQTRWMPSYSSIFRISFFGHCQNRLQFRCERFRFKFLFRNRIAHSNASGGFVVDGYDHGIRPLCAKFLAHAEAAPHDATAPTVRQRFAARLRHRSLYRSRVSGRHPSGRTPRDSDSSLGGMLCGLRKKVQPANTESQQADTVGSRSCDCFRTCGLRSIRFSAGNSAQLQQTSATKLSHCLSTARAFQPSILQCRATPVCFIKTAAFASSRHSVASFNSILLSPP